MALPLDEKHLDVFEDRVRALQADSPRKWGSLTPAAMLAHCRVVLEMSLEERPVKNVSTTFSRSFMRYMVINWLPIPQGRIKAPPGFMAETCDGLDAERDLFLKGLARFVGISMVAPARVTLHGYFGPLTMREWQKLHGKHFDHHLRQFGC